jgi:Flp pilus assembly protein TadD
VTPTVLTLFGLPVGADMDGRPWVEAMDGGVEPDAVMSWDQVPGEAGMHPPELREAPAESLEAIRHLIELGYVEPPDEDARRVIERTLEQNRFNLARSLVDARQPTRAIQLLEELVKARPTHVGYNVALFEACYAVGRNADCRRIAEAMWSHGYRGPLVHLALASMEIAGRRTESALRLLREAERVIPDEPGLYVLTGRAYVRLQQWEEARRAFEKALKLDGDSESAWHGLAQAALGRGEYEAAAEHALRAVSLRSDYAEAHYHLGVALSRLGMPRDAEAALRRCLAVQPNIVAAYGRLIELYEGPLLNEGEARRCHRQAQEVMFQRRLRRRQDSAAPLVPGTIRAASGRASPPAGPPPSA